MKKLIYTLTAAILLTLSSTASIAASNDKAPVSTEAMSPEAEAKLAQIKQRVEEIRDMDKSGLSQTERKELRKELREMKAQARAVTGGGVYLSVGAIIIIILVLIILL